VSLIPSLPRFFAPDAGAIGDLVRLSAEEGRHLISVLRLRAGAQVGVFDGRGHEYVAEIEAIERAGVMVRLLDAIEPAPEPSVAVTLAQALLKGHKFDEVVRDATMLGVAAVQPLVTARTDVPAPAGRRVADRWRNIAIASAKQSRRAVVPEVRPPRTFEDWLASEPADLAVLLVEPLGHAERSGHLRLLADRPRPRRAVIAVGPEGGWAEVEVRRAADAGFLCLRLGGRTLRADAVAVAAVAVLQFVWGDL